MANAIAAPLSHATAISPNTDLQLSTAVLQREIIRILAESGELDSIGIVRERDPINGSGSVSQQYPMMELDGQGGMSSLTEVEAVSETGLGADSITLSVSRYGKKIPISDLLLGSNKVGLNLELLAEIMANSRRTQRNADICATWATAAKVVGTTGAVLTVDTVYEALDRASVDHIPPLIGDLYGLVLKPKQVNQLRSSIRAVDGVLRERVDIQEFSRLRSGMVQGIFENCVIFKHDAVSDDATDFAGALLGRDAVHGTHLDQPLPPAGNWAMKFPNMPGFMLEMSRDPDTSKTAVVANDWHGFTLDADRCVRIRSGV